MVKIFGKIQHKRGVEGTGPEGCKAGFRSDAWKWLLGIVVRGIGHEGQNLQIDYGNSGVGDWKFEGEEKKMGYKFRIVGGRN